jgi:hypothetical protein
VRRLASFGGTAAALLEIHTSIPPPQDFWLGSAEKIPERSTWRNAIPFAAKPYPDL